MRHNLKKVRTTERFAYTNNNPCGPYPRFAATTSMHTR